MEAVDRVLALIERLRAKGFEIRHADFGGGLGVGYKPEETTPDIEPFVADLRAHAAGRGLQIMIEPGRSIVADAGVLLTRVLYRKKTGEKEFVIVDAAMNDLIRPALYSAHHEIVPVRKTDAGDDEGRHRRARLRKRRFSGARSRNAAGFPRRSARDLLGGSVRICAIVELQFASACSGSAGRRRCLAGGAADAKPTMI